MISSPSSPELESNNTNNNYSQQTSATTAAQSQSQSQSQRHSKPLLPRNVSNFSATTSEDLMALDPPTMQEMLEAREILEATSMGDTSSMTQAQKDYLLAEPGSAWKSKKAMDEYRRAMESVVDQDFNLGELDIWGKRCARGGD